MKKIKNGDKMKLSNKILIAAVLLFAIVWVSIFVQGLMKIKSPPVVQRIPFYYLISADGVKYLRVDASIYVIIEYSDHPSILIPDSVSFRKNNYRIERTNDTLVIRSDNAIDEKIISTSNGITIFTNSLRGISSSVNSNVWDHSTQNDSLHVSALDNSFVYVNSRKLNISLSGTSKALVNSCSIANIRMKNRSELNLEMIDGTLKAVLTDKSKLILHGKIVKSDIVKKDSAIVTR